MFQSVSSSIYVHSIGQIKSNLISFDASANSFLSDNENVPNELVTLFSSIPLSVLWPRFSKHMLKHSIPALYMPYLKGGIEVGSGQGSCTTEGTSFAVAAGAPPMH